MTSTSTIIDNTDPAVRHDWEIAGEAWGSNAIEWATLFEHYALDVITAMIDQLDLGPDSTVVDIACGSGLALRLFGGTGAQTAGIDAAGGLVDLARERNPRADVRHGTMFDLPWADQSFDAVTSVNGIWGGNDAALEEAYRVLRPGGSVAISFWGDGQPMDLKPCFVQFAINAPHSHLKGMKRTNDIATPGVAESMLEVAGFERCRRDQRISVIEWPDADTAWRALSSTGPAQPALRAVGPEVLRAAMTGAIEVCRQPSGLYRFYNDHQFVVAHKPS